MAGQRTAAPLRTLPFRLLRAVLARARRRLRALRREPDALEASLCVARLYLVVLGRSADPDGLAAHASALRDGTPVEALARTMLGSGEFRAAVTGGDVAAHLLRNHRRAGGLLAGDHAARRPVILRRMAATARARCAARRGPEALACWLVTGARGRRLTALRALFPDGIPLADAPAYRRWLDETGGTLPPAPSVLAAPCPTLSVVLVADAARVEAVRRALRRLRRSGPPVRDVALHVPGRPGPARRRALLRLARAHGAAVTDPGPPVPEDDLPHGAPGALSRAEEGEARRLAAALSGGAGDLACLLGCDDVPAPEGWAALADPGARELILTDSDLLGPEGRHAPRLHGGWDPEALLAGPPSGLVLAPPARCRTLRLQPGPVAALRWDMLLQLAEPLPEGAARHLPAVLVSHARPPDVPPSVATRLLRRALCRRSLSAGVMEDPPGSGGAASPGEPPAPRLRHRPPHPAPLASLVIPTRDRRELLAACLSSIAARTVHAPLELVLVDNGTITFDVAALARALLPRHPVRVLHADGAFNWSRLSNLGVAASGGEVAVLLNNDVEVLAPDWLGELVGQVLRPGVGAAGAKLLYPDGTVQHAGLVLGPQGRSGHAWRHAPGDAPGPMGALSRVRRVSAVTGACLAIRRTVFDAVGGCDERALPVAWNDVDLCLKVWAAGHAVLWTPHALLLHREQASRGSDHATPERRARLEGERQVMLRRWGGRLDADPFFSPLLLPAEEPEPRLRTAGG